jgi:hypothetical protein
VLRDHPTVQWRAGIEISTQLKAPTSKTLVRSPVVPRKAPLLVTNRARLDFDFFRKRCNFEQSAHFEQWIIRTRSTERSWVGVDSQCRRSDPHDSSTFCTQTRAYSGRTSQSPAFFFASDSAHETTCSQNGNSELVNVSECDQHCPDSDSCACIECRVKVQTQE